MIRPLALGQIGAIFFIYHWEFTMDLARENQTSLNTPELEESVEVRNEAKSESLSKVNSAWTFLQAVKTRYSKQI